MKHALFLLTMLVMAPSVGWTASWGKNCTFVGTAGAVIGTPANVSQRLGANEKGCWRFNNADGVVNLGYIQSSSSTNLICYDPDLFATTTNTGRVIPHLCTAGGPVDAANPLRSCIGLGGANASVSLDGTEGPAPTQNACIRVGPGTFLVEVSAACIGGTVCQVSIQAEPPGTP